MDLHSITIKQDPKLLKENILNLAISYLAFGIDPKKSIIFIQNQVSAHSELAWLLGTITPMGWLSRMTQYKDKAGDKNNNLGLFSYPVLMAKRYFALSNRFSANWQGSKTTFRANS